jgi:GNAT superfamily N-acetyltransferase
MDTTELRIGIKTSLSEAELHDICALVGEARWNQVAADWRVFIERGRVYAAHSRDGCIVGTTATLPYGDRFAWISMVLVAGPYRRRGLATLLMRRALDDLATARLVAVLDATPEGRGVYAALGFVDCWGLHRVGRERRDTPGVKRQQMVAPPGDVRVRFIEQDDWPLICSYDAAAFGADRTGVLAALRGRLPPAERIALSGGRVVGFSLGRDGRVAAHIGPVVAESDAIACALVGPALDGIDGRILIDVADEKIKLRSFLEQRGFAVVRPFTRMLHGRSQRFDDPARTFAVVGPEFG